MLVDTGSLCYEGQQTYGATTIATAASAAAAIGLHTHKQVTLSRGHTYLQWLRHNTYPVSVRTSCGVINSFYVSPSMCMSMSVHTSVCLSMCLSVFVCLLIYHFVHTSVCESVSHCFCLYPSVFVCLCFVCVCLYACLDLAVS